MSAQNPHELDRERLSNAGWRQGTLIRKAGASLAIVKALGDGPLTHWLVLTQDCDLLQPNLTKEPWCELLGCRLVQNRADGNLLDGKNPRRIHFAATVDGVAGYLEACVHERVRLPRELLVDGAPDAHSFLSSGTTRMVIGWIARRYTRSAFPDAFNDRMLQAAPAIASVLKKHGDVVDSIYLMLHDSTELPSNQVYKVEVIVVMKTGDYAVAGLRDRAQKVADAFEQEWSQCPGIEVSKVELRPELEVTLEDLNYVRRWDAHDYLSHDGGL